MGQRAEGERDHKCRQVLNSTNISSSEASVCPVTENTYQWGCKTCFIKTVIESCLHGLQGLISEILQSSAMVLHRKFLMFLLKLRW